MQMQVLLCCAVLCAAVLAVSAALLLLPWFIPKQVCCVLCQMRVARCRVLNLVALWWETCSSTFIMIMIANDNNDSPTGL